MAEKNSNLSSTVLLLFKTSIFFHNINRTFVSAWVPVRLMALALLIRMSMPPKCLTVCSTESWMAVSDLTSTTTGSALPPSSSISLAAVKMYSRIQVYKTGYHRRVQV